MIKLYIYSMVYNILRRLTILTECPHKKDYSERKTIQYEIYKKLCYNTMRLSLVISRARK